MPNTKIFAYFAILIGATFIGFSGILFRASGMSAASGIFWRMFLALPFYFIWMKLEKNEINHTFSFHKPLLLAGLFFALDMTTFHYALQFTGVGKATLLGSMATLLVVVASLFLGERITTKIALALVLALIGSVLIVTTKSGFILHGGELKGDIISVSAAFFFATYILLVRWGRKTISAGTFNFYMAAYCAAFSLLFAFIMGETIWPASLASWGYLLLLGVLIQAVGQGLTTFALGQIPAGVGSIAMTFNAPVSVVAAALVFNEVPVFMQIIGGIFVIIALILVRPK